MEEVKMKKVILISIALSMLTFSQSAWSQASSSQSAYSQAYIEAHKEILNNYYQDRIMEERLSGQTQIRLLEVAEKCYSNCQTGIYDWAKLAETVLGINDLERQSFEGRPFSYETAPEYLAEALSQIAIRKSQIMDDMEWQTTRLDRIRKYEITEGLENLIKNRDEALVKKPVETYGVVAGIIFSQDKPVAFIDNTAVHPGESVHDVKIVSINKGSVEFEKSGSIWTQKVGEKQEDKWK
jgi:hypothetical protein